MIRSNEGLDGRRDAGSSSCARSDLAAVVKITIARPEPEPRPKKDRSGVGMAAACSSS